MEEERLAGRLQQQQRLAKTDQGLKEDEGLESSRLCFDVIID